MRLRRLARLVGRLLGWLLIAAGLAAAGPDLYGWWQGGGYQATPLGQLWYDLHRDSFVVLQPAIERHVWPPLWSHVVFPVLTWPAAAVFAVPGVVLAVACRRRGRR